MCPSVEIKVYACGIAIDMTTPNRNSMEYYMFNLETSLSRVAHGIFSFFAVVRKNLT